jgi:hypothetical protein
MRSSVASWWVISIKKIHMTCAQQEEVDKLLNEQVCGDN